MEEKPISPCLARLRAAFEARGWGPDKVEVTTLPRDGAVALRVLAPAEVDVMEAFRLIQEVDPPRKRGTTLFIRKERS